MALRPCRDCKREVSTNAKVCPHCGTPQPATFLAMSGGARNALGCVGVIFVGGLIGMCAGDEEAMAPAAPATVAATPEQAAAARTRDSTEAVRRLTAPMASRADTVAVDVLAHLHGLDIPHDTLHGRAISIAIDSARSLIRTRGASAGPDRAIALLDRADSPFSAVQSRRIREVRAEAQAEARRIDAAVRLAARRAFGEQYEQTLLGQGIDAQVSVRGQQATTLRLDWVLANRPLVYQFGQDGEKLEFLRSMGFRRLEITDGYDRSWVFDLTK